MEAWAWEMFFGGFGFGVEGCWWVEKKVFYVGLFWHIFLYFLKFG